MRINVKLFAMLRDSAGVSQLTLDLPAGARASTALDAVRELHPTTKEILARSAIAVNQEYVARDVILADGDEIAVIPPVSGG